MPGAQLDDDGRMQFPIDVLACECPKEWNWLPPKHQSLP